MNRTALSLSGILIQIMSGRVIPALDIEADSETDLNGMLQKYSMSKTMIEEVLLNGGIDYMEAVKWCLDSVLGNVGLEDEEFCGVFYKEVVMKLRKLLQSS